MTHDDEVCAHRLERFHRFAHRLAFGDRRVSDIEVGDIRREAFGRDFERRVSARAGLVEEHQDRLAFERRDFFDRSCEELFERYRLVKKMVDLFATE